jgi:insecticidal toxin complex protein TccC
MNTAVFSTTPSVVVHDTRGLLVRDIAYHRHPDTLALTESRITRHRFDTRGRLSQSTDPRLHDLRQADTTVQPNFVYHPSLTGTVLRTDSVDAGTTLALADVAGRPALAVSATGMLRTWQYEDTSLPGRPLSVTEQASGQPARITERFVWADASDAQKSLNLVGQCVCHYDTAGRVQLSSLSLTGATLSQTRQLLPDEREADWQGANESVWGTLLSGSAYVTRSTADATGAVVTSTDAKGHLQRVAYDVAGQLKGSWLTVNGGSEQVIVQSLTYSAAGQKLREEHGNGVVTTYTYEPETQRLTGVKTERLAGHASGAKVLQDLRYEYDPVGNVLKISNDAEETRFWRNQKVVPENAYVYDSLYQLVNATGREMANAGQQGSGLPLPTDNSTYTNYLRTYTYDTAGNLTQMRHSAPAAGNSYTTAITVSTRSNRGVLSTLTKKAADVDALFTAAGQQTELLPGQQLIWTARNELQQVMPVVREGSPGDVESYRYDGSSQRIVKIGVQKTGNSTQAQRVVYLPGLELRSTKSGDTETESLQVITVGVSGRAQVRVLHWETGRPADITNDQVRYSYDNLIGSSGLEVAGDGNLISMEEYYPYGGTAILTARSQVEADYKTIRYSGKERDATGLYYYGYRYYQPWAGRWLSADPAGTVDGLNLFRMCRNNPIIYSDYLGLDPVRTHFDEKDIEGFSSISRSIATGLIAGRMSPEDTVFVMLGRSPQTLGEYLNQSGFNTVLLQASGLSTRKKMTSVNNLSDEQRNNREAYFRGSLGEAFSKNKNAVLLDYAVTGNSLIEMHKVLKETFAGESINIKMAVVSRFLDESDLTDDEKAIFHHDDNILYDADSGKGRLNYKNRGVMRALKIMHHEIDKGLSYTDKFHYTKIDSGDKPIIMEDKRTRLSDMMKTAIGKHSEITYSDMKNQGGNRFKLMLKGINPKYHSTSQYIKSYNFKRATSAVTLM